MNEPKLWLYVGLVAFGIVGHLGKRLWDLERAGTILWPLTFIRQRPYTFAMTVIGAYMLAVTLYFVGQLNEAMAIACGVAGNEAFDTVRARAAGKLQESWGENPGV